MNSFVSKSCGFILVSVILLCKGVTADKDTEYNCNYNYEKDEWEGCGHLSTGAIIGISIAVLIVIIGVPFLLCFCCAWCCFKGRNTKGKVHAQTVFVTSSNQPQRIGQPITYGYPVGSLQAQSQPQAPQGPGYYSSPPPYYQNPTNEPVVKTQYGWSNSQPTS